MELVSLSRTPENVILVQLRLQERTQLLLVPFAGDDPPELAPPHSFIEWAAAHPRAASEALRAITLFITSPESISLPIRLDASLLPADYFRLTGTRYATLSPELVGWWASYLATHGDTTLFQRPFEYSVLSDRTYNLTHRVAEYGAKPVDPTAIRTTWSPKGSGPAVRFATQLDPVDTLRSSAALFELAERFEKMRAPIDVVHSFRFAQRDAGPWLPGRNHDSFVRESVRRAEESRFVLSVDIADFYYRIKREQLFSHLEAMGLPIRSVLRSRDLLRALPGPGLPVGPAFATWAAEVVLDIIDRAIVLERLPSYVRFHDDFRFFCKTEGEARSTALSVASLIADRCGLSLQSGKTRIQASPVYIDQNEPSVGWLRKLEHLRREADYGALSGPTPQHEAELIRSAEALIERGVASDSGAWVALVGRAFDALPFDRLLQHLPTFLLHFDTLWPLARRMATRVARETYGDVQRQREFSAVLQRCQPAKCPSDWANSWLIWTSYFGRESTGSFQLAFGSGQLVNRESLLSGQREIQVPSPSPWLLRAQLAMGLVKAAQVPKHDDQSAFLPDYFEAIRMKGSQHARSGPRL